MPIRSPYKMKEDKVVSLQKKTIEAYLIITPGFVDWLEDGRREIYNDIYEAALAVQQENWKITRAVSLADEYVVYVRGILKELEQITSDFTKVASGDEDLQCFIDRLENCTLDNKKYPVL